MIFKTTIRRFNSWWTQVHAAPPDAILGLTEAYKLDANPNKVNLGVGAYRDDDGKPYVLPSVRKAELHVSSKNMNKEYARISGIDEFCEYAADLALGSQNDVILQKSYATVQTISGTGALSIGAHFLKHFFPGEKIVYMPKPTWGNHQSVFKRAGLALGHYKYYSPESQSLDFHKTVKDICEIPQRSIILLHACAHNPTGTDPTPEQWAEISKAIKKRHLFPFFDMAYQGFATGDTDRDAYAVRLFIKDGHRIAIAQSFAKNMGLYGERIGALTLTTDDTEQAGNILSQIKIIIRSLYSSPPINGARIVATILRDPELKADWLVDVKGMSGRIMAMRRLLTDNLKREGSLRNWDHINKQIGMFCYTGMNEQQVQQLIKEHSVYLTKDGRISVAGINSKNVEYLAHVMHKVTK